MRPLARHRVPLRALVQVATVALTLALGGCSAVNGMLGGSSAVTALADVKWRFAQRAIEVRWQADNALNSANGKPHALLVAVLQMAETDAFRAASVTPARLAQLLAAPVAPPGFLSVERVFVQPGQTASVSLARVDHARFVGVVAGYYGLGDSTGNRIGGMGKESGNGSGNGAANEAANGAVNGSSNEAVNGAVGEAGGINALDPARVARVYEIGVAIKSRGLLVKHRSASVEPLVIDLRLGSAGIVAGAASNGSSASIGSGGSGGSAEPAQSTQSARADQ